MHATLVPALLTVAGAKQWNVSPRTLIAALIINGLVERQPLHNVQRFYEGMDMPLLFEEPK
ncbi:MAG TPA: hypothetical protein DDZ66_07225 [Firmicutes bacterium]|nr:hypothetical protein [Bacillota bacterium]